MKTLFLVLLALSSISFANDLEVKFQSCNKETSDALILEAAKWVDTRVKGLSSNQIEALFYKDTFESELVTRFGSQYLPQNTRLSLGAKACGTYMQRYIASLKAKSPKQEEIQFWTSCMKNDYVDQIPKIAQTLIECRK